jgi:hypothetical protein
MLGQSFGTNDGINQMGTNNRPENGRGAWVALCATPLMQILNQRLSVELYLSDIVCIDSTNFPMI